MDPITLIDHVWISGSAAVKETEFALSQLQDSNRITVIQKNSATAQSGVRFSEIGGTYGMVWWGSVMASRCRKAVQTELIDALPKSCDQLAD